MIFTNGVTGSLGRYLLQYLEIQQLPHEIIQTRLENAALLSQELKLKSLSVDAHSVVLVHLAALVPVVQCEQHPELAHNTNVVWTTEYVRGFVEWAHTTGKKVKVLYVSSGHVYAKPKAEEKAKEGHDLLPRSVYATTKLEAEQSLQYLATQMGFQLIIPRVFGLLAPRQPPFYALQGLLRRAHQKKFATVPGLHSVRDYLDARDVSRILIQLSETDFSGVVNVCSAEGCTISFLLETIVQTLYPLEAKSMIESFQAAPERPDGTPYLVGDNYLLTKKLNRVARTISYRTTIDEATRLYGNAT